MNNIAPKLSAQLLLCSIATPFAYAQSSPSTPVSDTTETAPPAGPPAGGPPPGLADSIFARDWITIGIGGGIRPSYEGSDDYNFGPAPLIQGSVDGFDFGARGPGLFVDVIRDGGRDERGQQKKIQFLLGPQVQLRLDRNNRIGDDVVALLGERDIGVEVGFTSGVSFRELLTPFDSLSFTLDAGWDVAGAHDGRVVRASVGYSTPLSRAAFANVSLSATHVDDNYADTYYSIDTAGSVASGLPVFDADGGVKSVGSFLVLGYDLSGNALDGGFSLFGLSSYTRLLGDAKRTPITSIRGDANQWFVGGGVAYSF
ncbi:MipA/OmpV family protein [Sphingorhabdus arenilitoris]|uniref:MipA/OmpV family protein n=1 Tax=Sphingorhabdus arenilitoris TaxID=1490041 RepID=A0ABV8RFE8_9SPHN